MNLSFATKTFESAADLLAAAREYIEKKGWIQGRYVDHLGQVCSVGSLAACQGISHYELAHATEWQIRLMHEAEEALLKALHPDPSERDDCSIPAWNDSRGRTKQEVLDLFAKAEKIERTGFDPDKGIVV